MGVCGFSDGCLLSCFTINVKYVRRFLPNPALRFITVSSHRLRQFNIFSCRTWMTFFLCCDSWNIIQTTQIKFNELIVDTFYIHQTLSVAFRFVLCYVQIRRTNIWLDKSLQLKEINNSCGYICTSAHFCVNTGRFIFDDDNLTQCYFFYCPIISIFCAIRFSAKFSLPSYNDVQCDDSLRDSPRRSRPPEINLPPRNTRTCAGL